MTCSHVPITKTEPIGGLLTVTCRCGHHWLEASIAMTHEEYDSSLMLLAAYDVARDWREQTADV